MKIRFALAFIIPAVVAGCSEEATSQSAPEVTAEAVQAQATVTWGSYSITASKPTGLNTTSAGNQQLYGAFTLSGGSLKSGVCLLSRIEDWDANGLMNPIACSSTAQCPAVSNYPAGSQVYCTMPEGVSSGQCFVRPGPQASYCAGSPAISGNPAIGAGTYYTPTVGAWTGGWGYYDYYDNYLVEHYQQSTTWFSQACMYGCSGGPPGTNAPTTPSNSTALAFYQGTYGTGTY